VIPVKRILFAAVAALGLILAMPAVASASVSAYVWNTDGDNLNVRASVSTTATIVASLAPGQTVTIDCQTTGPTVDGPDGATSIWDHLPAYGGYATDAYLYTGYDGWDPNLPRCATAPPGASDPVNTNGFDMSDLNPGTVDFASAAQQYGFADFKASQGDYLTDSKFAERVAGAKGKMIIQAYHFFDPRDNGASQADYLAGVLSAAGYRVSDKMTLPIMVDLEPNYCSDELDPSQRESNCDATRLALPFCWIADSASSTLNARVADFVSTVTSDTGAPPMVYTNADMTDSCGLDTTPLHSLKLVAPSWNGQPQAVADSLGWSTYTFTQTAAYTTVPGGVGALPDTYHGSTASLAALADG
jgi:GH25 family lysozyme M1 (1,4-beta-N-acetylmuramidase)